MSQPHDSIFKAVFGRIEHAAGLLRGILSAELAELADAIDWSTLTLLPGSFINEKLDPSHTDLLFSVVLGNRQILLYVLKEHQSRNDRRMPLRLYGYLDDIWASFDENEDRNRSLPPILYIVLGHTEELLWAGLDIWGRRMAEVLLSPDGTLFLSYFKTRVQDFSWPEVRAKLARVAPEAKDRLMELYEDFRAEGRAQGLEQGRAAMAALLAKLLSSKFGALSDQAQARLASASMADFDKWAERVLQASSLDEVFAG
ncbi:MAG: Rpn family recombination-promoting nuclease/putative transposase [Deltaproteobacteria bacterium]|nr:Rpn family recombination-promoting nuclease/putative transposase [Deltaproteobacteria bacterium]